jgi:hypothetical protein
MGYDLQMKPDFYESMEQNIAFFPGTAFKKVLQISE